jgi:hypothetical protein
MTSNINGIQFAFMEVYEVSKFAVVPTYPWAHDTWKQN